jgi:hypothetical protein
MYMCFVCIHGASGALKSLFPYRLYFVYIFTFIAIFRRYSRARKKLIFFRDSAHPFLGKTNLIAKYLVLEKSDA